MDTLLVNGDHFKDKRGYPAQIFGEEELIQKILLKLLIPKGSFVLDTSLGSQLYKLPPAINKANTRTALSYILNALEDVEQITNISVKLNLDTNNNLVIYINAKINNKQIAFNISP